MIPALGRRIAVAVTIVLAAAPLSALAQQARTEPSPIEPPGDSVAQAAAHFARGVKLYQEDDFRAALIEFHRAYELAPNWAALYNVGQSQYQLREYPDALRTLERYVKEGGDAIAPDRRAQVDREIGELRGRVSRVVPVSNVDGADVALDDVALGVTTPTKEPLVVGEGRHRLTLTKSGYVTVTKSVDIAGGDSVTIRLDMSPAAPPVHVPPPEPRSYTAAIVAGIFGGAGIAVGTTFGLLAVSDRSTLRSECNATKVCPSKAQDDIDAFSRNGTISTVGFGVGATGVVFATYFFFHERAQEGPRRLDAASNRAATIRPWIGPGAGGIVGTF